MNQIKTIHLENGLTLYMLNDKRRHSTFFQFTTFCGGISKHFKCDNKEYSLQDGVAHILEHYIVECNSQGNFLDELGKYQMYTNAATSIDTTTYYFETVENVTYGINTMLNGIYHVDFKKEKLQKLKNPIKQEIRGKLDNKFYHLNRLKMKNLFPSMDYRDIGGLLEEIDKTSIEDLKILYKAFYQPKNQFIIIAGNYDEKEVLETINNFYKNEKLKEHQLEIIHYPIEERILKKEDYFFFPTPENYIELSFKIPKQELTKEEQLDFEFYLVTFLNTNFGRTSSLYKELKEQKIITEPMSFKIQRIEKQMIISIGNYSNNINVLKEKIIETINKKEIDKKLFELEKQESTIQLILRDENIFKMIGPFINNIVVFDYPYLDKIEDIKRLNMKDYHRMIKKLNFDNYIEIIIKKTP